MRTPATSRAFTLLEMLLSVVIISSIFLLAGIVWQQGSAWAAETEQRHEALRVHRVLDLLSAQWHDRRLGDAQGAGVSATPESILFVTGTPILFPDWPLVVAEYKIEAEDDLGDDATRRYRLRYTERRLDDFTLEPLKDAHKLDRPLLDSGETDRDTLVVLEHLRSLRLERFGKALDDSAIALLAADAADGIDSPAVRDATALAWRPYDAEFAGEIHALRFVGKYRDQEFACVLSAAGSR